MLDEQKELMSRRAYLTLTASSLLAKVFVDAEQPQPAYAIPKGVGPHEMSRIRLLCSTPLEWVEPQRTLLWAELPTADSEDPKVMFWTPETADEHAEADRFVRAAKWRSWRSEGELRSLLSQAPQWAVRLRLIGGRYLFVSDEAAAAETGGPIDELNLTTDSSEAAIVTAARARELVLGLPEEWGLGDDDDMLYFEPVTPKQLTNDLRWAAVTGR